MNEVHPAPPRQAPLLDLDLLRTLVAIAEEGSFSAAAARVLRTPSAVSMQVKKIEDLLGRPVFLRDSRSVSLTADGKFLLEHARRMLDLNQMAMARFVQPDLQGEVRLGAPDNVAERFLPQMLCRFAESYPAVTVHVTVEGSRKMAQMHRQGALDLAIISDDVAAHQEGPAEMIFREKLVWGMCEGGVAPERDPLPVSVWDESCSWRRAGTEALEAQNRHWKVVFQSSYTAGQRAAILADLAVAPLASSSLGGGVIEAGAHLGLPPLPEIALFLLVPEGPSAPVCAAIDHLRESFARQ